MTTHTIHSLNDQTIKAATEPGRYTMAAGCISSSPTRRPLLGVSLRTQRQAPLHGPRRLSRGHAEQSPRAAQGGGARRSAPASIRSTRARPANRRGRLAHGDGSGRGLHRRDGGGLEDQALSCPDPRAADTYVKPVIGDMAISDIEPPRPGWCWSRSGTRSDRPRSASASTSNASSTGRSPAGIARTKSIRSKSSG